MTAPGGEGGPSDHDLAARLAGDAGRLLLSVRAEHRRAPDLGGRGDRAANALLVGELRRLRPSDAVLSEEEADDLARLDAGRVWIVDPLDGTREFAEPDRIDWAVHVALWERDAGGAGGELTAAAVALPAEGVVFSTAAPPPMPPRPGGPPRIVVSRSRPPAEARQVAATLEAVVAPLGSAGAKAMAVVRGDADIYLHAGGQREWDSAAPVGVALAAGFHASRLDGRPLRYNQRDTVLPDLVLCRPELAGAVLDALRHPRGVA